MGFLWNCLERKELVHRSSRSCSVNETVLGFTAVYCSTASHERDQNLVSFTMFANPLNLGTSHEEDTGFPRTPFLLKKYHGTMNPLKRKDNMIAGK
jgi:hypothetical protein